MTQTFRSWTERLAAAAMVLCWRLVYTRKSTETAERQVESHKQQAEKIAEKWGPIDPIWRWEDSASGTTFNRPGFQDMLDFCRKHPVPKGQSARVELYDASRFSRVLNAEGKPDLIAFQNVYNEFELLGWQLHFVTRERTGNQLFDSLMLQMDAYSSAEFSEKQSVVVRRGVANHSKAGWWTHGSAPWGTQRMDKRTNRILRASELATPGGGNVMLIPDPAAIELWNRAAHRIVAGASLEAVGRELFKEGYLGPRGGKLGHSTIKKLMTNRALIGRLTYRDDGRGERAQHEVDAQWSPMVSEELFDLVGERLASRTPDNGGRHRRRRELYPLSVVCAHCGLEYNGGRNKKEQGSKRCYTHANPKQRAQPEHHEQMNAAACNVWSVDAADIEDQIKDLIVRERASDEFEGEMRRLLHDRDERRKDAERMIADARERVAECERTYRAMSRAVAKMAGAGAEPSEDDPLMRELVAAKRQIATANRDLTEAERFARSHEDSWQRLSAIIHETRNIGQIWDRCSPEDRAALLDYWVLDVLVVVERIPEKRRANFKTAVVTLRTAPHAPRYVDIESRRSSSARSADAISSRTSASGSSFKRSRSAVATGEDPSRPSAQAAWPRTSDDSSRSAAMSAGASSDEPTLPKTTAALRRKPESLARFMGEPLNAAVYSGTDIPSKRVASDLASMPSTTGRGANLSSVNGSENLRLYGHTSWHTSQPYSRSPTSGASAASISPRSSMVSVLMHCRASSTRGATNACVGHASRHRVHRPHRSASKGASGTSGHASTSAPRKKKLPRVGLMSRVFLPNHPSPARRARSRSSSGPEST
jgi:DNA invertase Pin-like site-specific DNA recombinase